MQKRTVDHNPLSSPWTFDLEGLEVRTEPIIGPSYTNLLQQSSVTFSDYTPIISTRNQAPTYAPAPVYGPPAPWVTPAPAAWPAPAQTYPPAPWAYPTPAAWNASAQAPTPIVWTAPAQAQPQAYAYASVQGAMQPLNLPGHETQYLNSTSAPITLPQVVYVENNQRILELQKELQRVTIELGDYRVSYATLDEAFKTENGQRILAESALHKQYALTKENQQDRINAQKEAQALRRQLEEAQAAAAQVAGLRRQLEEAQAGEKRVGVANAQADAERERAALVNQNTQLQQKKEDISLDWTGGLELDKRKQSQKTRERTDDTLLQLEKNLAAAQVQRDQAVAAQALAQAKALTEENNELKKQIENLKSTIIDLKKGFEKIEKEITSFFSKKNKEHQIVVKEVKKAQGAQGAKNDFSLSWEFDPRELAKTENTEYNMFSKFPSFQGENLSHIITVDQKKDVSKITLLKIKIIQLGIDANREHLDSDNPSINKLLTQIGIGQITHDENDIKKFCKKYFNLGHQYRKIFNDSNSHDAILKMMSDDFGKDTFLFTNKEALKWKESKPEKFKGKIEELSQVAFGNIDSETYQDQIQLFAIYEIGLAKACKGYKEITGAILDANNYSGQITPEIAKVFVELDEGKQNQFFGKIDTEKKQTLKELIKTEKSRIESKFIEIAGNNKFLFDSPDFLSKFIFGDLKTLNHHQKTLSKSLKQRYEKCKKLLEDEKLFKSVPDLDVKAETNPALQFFNRVSVLLDNLIFKDNKDGGEPNQIIFGSDLNPLKKNMLMNPVPITNYNALSDSTQTDVVIILPGHYSLPSSSYPPTYESVVNSSQSNSEKEVGAGVWDLNGGGNSSDSNSDTSTPRATTATSAPRAPTATSTAGVDPNLLRGNA